MAIYHGKPHPHGADPSEGQAENRQSGATSC